MTFSLQITQPGAVNSSVLRQSEHYGAARSVENEHVFNMPEMHGISKQAHPQPRQRRAELCFGKAAAPADSWRARFDT